MSYVDDITNQRVIIVGMVPPPLGGISVHIKRVVAALHKQCNRVLVIDVCKEYAKRSRVGYAWFLARSIIVMRPHVIYYHVLLVRKNLSELILLVLLKYLCGSQLVLVEHSERFVYTRTMFYKKLLSFLIRHCTNRLVLMGPAMFKAYQDNGVYIPSNIQVVSPFIEPDQTEEIDVFEQYPLSLRDFMRSKRLIMVVNASSFCVWDGQDLYGIDLCIRLLNDLPEDCGLVCVVAAIKDSVYHKQITQEFSRYANAYVLVTCQVELWPLIKCSQVFLRPTRRDTMSVSVQEALFFGVCVIASDACQRPDGCVLFRTGNYEDFREKILASNIVSKSI